MSSLRIANSQFYLINRYNGEIYRYLPLRLSRSSMKTLVKEDIKIKVPSTGVKIATIDLLELDLIAYMRKIYFYSFISAFYYLQC